MTPAYRIVLLGFSDFERRTLASCFRLATRREPSYEHVQQLADADFVVADADHAPSVQLVVATERLPQTVFIGWRAPAGCTAWMSRPIDPLHVMRELDAMVSLQQQGEADHPQEPAPQAPAGLVSARPWGPAAPEPATGSADAGMTQPGVFAMETGPRAAGRGGRWGARASDPATGAGGGWPAEGADTPPGDGVQTPTGTPEPEPPVWQSLKGVGPTDTALWLPAGPASVPAAPPAPAVQPLLRQVRNPPETPAAAAAPVPPALALPVVPVVPEKRADDPVVPVVPDQRADDAVVEPAAGPTPHPATGLAAGHAGASGVASPAAPTAKPPPLAVAEVETPRPRALLVDDSEIALRFLEARLQPWGLQIDRAGSSHRAIELLSSRSYELVFLDVELGDDSDMDGLGLCQYIKRGPGLATAPGSSVFMVSAHQSQLDRVRGTLAGCDAYLGKPLQDDQLRQVLQRHGLRPLAKGTPAAGQPPAA